MAGFLGANTEQLAAHGDVLERGARRLEDLRRMLDGIVLSAQVWVGPDAEDFRGRWAGVIAPQLGDLGSRIGAYGHDAHTHAMEQDQASSPEGDEASGSRGGSDDEDGDHGLQKSPRGTRKAVPGDYDYDREYDLDVGPNGPQFSGEQLWDLALEDFSSVFPIPGMIDNPQVGDQIDLMGSPVEVTAIDGRSLSLVSLPGHIEGAGNTIVFTISEDGTSFDVEARGPQGTLLPNILPDIFWPMFANNLEDLQHVSIMAPGPSDDGLV